MKSGGVDKERLTREYNAALKRARATLTRDPRSVIRMCDQLRKLAKQIGRPTREADALAKEARKESDYRTAFDQAKRFLQTNQLDEAQRAGKKARTIKYTRDVVDLLKTVEGRMAVKAADVAEAAGDWAKVVEELEKAARNGIDVAARLEKAKAKVKDGQVGGFLAEADEMGKALKWAQVDTVRVAKLADAGNETAKALTSKYPLKAEAKMIDAAAAKPYKALLARIKKIAKPKHTARIDAIRAAMPDFAASKKYTASAKKLINKENDALFSGKYKTFTIDLKKIKTLAGQIDFIQQQAPVFAETSFKAKIAKTLAATKTKKAAGIFKTESAKIKKATKIDAKIMAIESALQIPDFKGTSFEKKLKGMLTGAKTTKAGAASKKLAADIKKCKTAIQKINRYEQALANPVFTGTKFVDSIKKSVKKERDGKAKVPFGKFMTSIKKKKGQARIAALTGALGESIYSGTSFLDKMTADIKKTKEALLASRFKKLLGDVKKMRTAQLRIAALEGALPTYAGTKFDKTIKGMIQKERDGILASRYKKLTLDIKKMKPLGKIERLKIAQQEFASSKKFRAAVDKLLKKEQDGLEKNMYSGILEDVKKQKTDAGKVRVLESRKGDLKSETYSKKIGAQIKKLKDGMDKAAKAARDKQLAGAYKTLTTKVANKKLKSADKVTILETEQGKFVGSGFADKIKAQIAKFKKAIAGEELKAADAKAKKVFDAIKLVKAKNKADCDGNIAKLEDAKFQVGKSSYAKKIDGLIAKERKAKAKFKK